MTPGWQRWAWMAAAAAVFLLPGLRQGWNLSPAPAKPSFAVEPPATGPDTNAPAMTAEFIDPDLLVPSVHVSSLCELPGNRLAATWYGGTREGATDVAIYFSIRPPTGTGSWSAPRPIVTAQSAQRETGRYVKKVGNALLFGDERGRLHLLYVSIALGGWSGSALNYKQSGDEGKTWTDSQPLMLSPFYNRSTLVKNGPAPLTDGGWAVPIYHELLGKFSEILWFQADPGGPPVKTRVTGGASHFQPSLTALNPTSGLLFNRAIGRVRKVHVARTADAGRTWSAPEPLPLLNPDSGLDAVRLRDGRLLLAYNDLPKFRENLTLALSADGGTNWTRVAVIEQQAGEEFSYPFLFQSRNGEVHLTYTWKRREIKHVTMTVSWIDQQLKEARP